MKNNIIFFVSNTLTTGRLYEMRFILLGKRGYRLTFGLVQPIIYLLDKRKELGSDRSGVIKTVINHINDNVRREGA